MPQAVIAALTFPLSPSHLPRLSHFLRSHGQVPCTQASILSSAFRADGRNVSQSRGSLGGSVGLGTICPASPATRIRDPVVLEVPLEECTSHLWMSASFLFSVAPVPARCTQDGLAQAVGMETVPEPSSLGFLLPRT